MNRDYKKALLAYTFLTGFNIFGTLVMPTLTAYLMPFLFVLIPIILQKTINTRFDIRHISIGTLASLVIVVLAYFFKGQGFRPPPYSYVFVTYLLVAFPEEVFFRGFLLECFGCNARGVVVSSLLFSLAHWHRFLLFGDYLAPMTFFPSLIMGLLYMKTRNTITSTLFHGTCNIVVYAVG